MEKVPAGFRETALPIREIDPGGYPRTGMADDKEAAYLSPRAGPVKARFVPSYAHKSADLRTAGGTRRGASGKGIPRGGVHHPALIAARVYRLTRRYLAG